MVGIDISYKHDKSVVEDSFLEGKERILFPSRGKLTFLATNIYRAVVSAIVIGCI